MPGKILILDDETDMLFMLEMLITDKTPHEVIATNNPFEVEELLSKNDFFTLVSGLFFLLNVELSVNIYPAFVGA